MTFYKRDGNPSGFQHIMCQSIATFHIDQPTNIQSQFILISQYFSLWNVNVHYDKTNTAYTRIERDFMNDKKKRLLAETFFSFVAYMLFTEWMNELCVFEIDSFFDFYIYTQPFWKTLSLYEAQRFPLNRMQTAFQIKSFSQPFVWF